MIILDTNVLSEFMQVTPNPHIVAWMDSQSPQSIWTTAITVYELWAGIMLLPQGHKRTRLAAAFQDLVSQGLQRRIMPLDETAAQIAGELAAMRKKAGTNVDARDTQIAGIAIACRAAIATRNEKDFKDLDVKIINPWTE